MSRDDRPARDLSDAERLARWRALPCGDGETSPEESELADEIERRGRAVGP